VPSIARAELKRRSSWKAAARPDLRRFRGPVGRAVLLQPSPADGFAGSV